MNNTLRYPERWLYAFIFIHVFIWTLAPILVRYNLPMDAMEGTTWGHQLEWGYDKNPFVNGWLTRVATLLGPSGWATYLFSQLSVGVCFFALWQMGKRILSPIHAVVGIMLLEGMQYYSFHAIDFNDNTLELGFWAVTCWFFYLACRDKKTRYWLGLGTFAALSMMVKYYTVMLLLPMLGILLSEPELRNEFKKSNLYLALLVFFIIITPHIVWLFQHDFITVTYAMNRVSAPYHWYNHLFYPLQFAWQQFEVFIPTLILSGFFILQRTPLVIQPFDRKFLWMLGVGPFVLTIALSAIAAIKLRAGWGQPLLSFWGFLLLVLLQPRITTKRFYTFATVVYALMLALALNYCYALIKAEEPSSANYPGTLIAQTLTARWSAEFHQPLKYVAGARWAAGNIAFYSKDKPTVYIDWNPAIATWIDETAMKKHGALFVWDTDINFNATYAKIRTRFPTLSKIETASFSWTRNQTAPPIQIRFAFLPPT